jgi:hypothetical protein
MCAMSLLRRVMYPRSCLAHAQPNERHHLGIKVDEAAADVVDVDIRVDAGLELARERHEALHVGVGAALERLVEAHRDNRGRHRLELLRL